MPPVGFQILDHPSDLGIRVWADNLPELFGQCALALTSVLVDVDTVASKDVNFVEVSADDLETLLYNWLSEIVYLFDGEGKLFSKFDVLEYKSNAGSELLRACLGGEHFNPARHELKTYIKAVTFHQLSIKQTPDGLSAQVYLDI